MEEESSEIHKKLKDDARVGKEIKDEDEGKTFERNRRTRPAAPSLRRLCTYTMLLPALARGTRKKFDFFHLWEC